MPALTWDQVRAWRLARHHLERPAPKRRLTDVVSDVCGVHGQVHSSAELSISARVDGASPEQIRDALWKRRTLVRSWAMRGTLHLLPARDFPIYVAALSTHDRWWKGSWLRYVELSADQLRAVLRAIHDALDDTPRTREELAERVARRVGPHVRKRLRSGWGELLKPAAFNGSLCSGPPRGQNVTFVRPDRWLRRWEEHDGQEAFREVLRRYLRAYGPSDHEDFAAWWGIAPAPARRLLRSIAGELEEVEVEGRTLWARRDDVGAMRSIDRPRGVRLLPGFDAYVMGFRPRDQLVEKRFADRVFRKAGWVSPVLLVDGRVAGVWAYERDGGRVEAGVEPFADLRPGQRKALREEGRRLSAFLGSPARVSVR